MSFATRSLSEERRDETKRPEPTGNPGYFSRTGFTYILRCADGTFYVGSTKDLAWRNAGFGSAYTRRRLPVELAWCEEFARIDDAFAWEKRIQGWSHNKREAFILGGLDAVRGWSARHRRRGDTSPGR